MVCTIIQTQAQSEQYAKTVRQLYNLQPDGSYNYAFETDNGILAEQQGTIDQSEPEPSQKVAGQYEYTSPEGQVIHLIYTAGKDGFRPSGSHLPVVPEIPILIRKSLEYLRSKGKL